MHPYHKWQDFLLSHGWIIFHYIYSIYIIHYIFFIHSSSDGHLSCFSVLAVVNKASVNMGVQTALQDSHFISTGYLPRSGTAGSCGSSRFNFLKNLHTVFHSSIPTNSAQEFPFLHILSNTCYLFHSLSFFFIIAILRDMRWYLIVGFLLLF